MAFDDELARAHGWLDHADRTSLEHFGDTVAAEVKADGTPVTAADRAIERALRTAIEAAYPADAIVGEEEGSSGAAERRWVIDPIDATKNFARGVPVFATLLGLEVEGRMVLGIASAPALGVRWWATRGGGAFRDGRPIRVSAVEKLSEATIASGGLDSVERHANLGGFLAVTRTAARHRGFGDFWGHVLVAQGSVEAMVDPIVAFYDVAPLQPIVAEAGGRMTTLGGDEALGGSCLSSNGTLHGDIVAVLAAGA